MSSWRKAIVTGLGTGYLPIAPGTWGSAVVCLIFLAVAFGSGGRTVCTTGTMLVLAVATSVACVALGRFTETAFGRKDPGQCNIDEWAGQAIALVFLPLRSSLEDWQTYLVVVAGSFVAFRFFDIVKPPPARQIEKAPAGWGILLDDLVAGLYANILCQIVFRLALT